MSGTPACRICLVTPPAFEPAAFASLLARVLDAGDVASLRLRLPAWIAGAPTVRPVARRCSVPLGQWPSAWLPTPA